MSVDAATLARTTAVTGRLPRRAEVALVLAVDALALTVALLTIRTPTAVAVTDVAAVLVLLAGAGVHRPRLNLRVGDLLPTLPACVGGALVVVAPFVPAESARSLLLLVPSAALLLVCGRFVSYAGLRAARRRRLSAERVLVVGAGDLAVRLVDVLRQHRELGLVPCGLVDDRPTHPLSPVPVLGRLADVPRLVRELAVRRIVVCFPAATGADLVARIRRWRALGVTIHVVPRLYELGVSVPRGATDDVWGIPLVRLRPAGATPAARVVKRCFDVLVGSVLLVLAAPVMLALALAVRLSGRPVLYRQARVGQDGRPVEIAKFRSVRGDVDADTLWAVPPARCTRVGRVLRATHLDELPQLLDAVRGRVSLVGPRPERPAFAAQFAEVFPGYDDRHRLPPGITGWAQVNGLTGDTSIAERARFDNHYIEHWSPWLDTVTLARTVTRVLSAARRR